MEMKSELDTSGSTEEIADQDNVGTETSGKTLDMQPDELTEGKITDIKEECGCDKKNEGGTEE